MRGLLANPGAWLMLIGTLHVGLGFASFRREFLAISRERGFNTVRNVPERRLAVFFMLFGVLAILTGALALWAFTVLGGLPAFFGWGLVFVAGVGVFFMPASGFWLVFMPALMILLQATGKG